MSAARESNKRLVTADEMLQMPDDGFRYHLIKGELQQKSLSGGFHGIIAARFGGALGQYVEAHDLGELKTLGGRPQDLADIARLQEETK